MDHGVHDRTLHPGLHDLNSLPFSWKTGRCSTTARANEKSTIASHANSNVDEEKACERLQLTDYGSVDNFRMQSAGASAKANEVRITASLPVARATAGVVMEILRALHHRLSGVAGRKPGRIDMPAPK